MLLVLSSNYPNRALVYDEEHTYASCLHTNPANNPLSTYANGISPIVSTGTYSLPKVYTTNLTIRAYRKLRFQSTCLCRESGSRKFTSHRKYNRLLISAYSAAELLTLCFVPVTKNQTGRHADLVVFVLSERLCRSTVMLQPDDSCLSFYLSYCQSSPSLWPLRRQPLRLLSFWKTRLEQKGF